MGVVVAVPMPDSGARTRLRRQWGRALADPTSSVDATADPPVSSGDDNAFDYRVTTGVTMAALKATAGTRVNLHAAGLADTEGRALALVAASGTGKTTATLRLGRLLGYLSDETVSIDADLVVHPHAKPLSVVIEGRPGEKLQCSPDELGLLPTPPSARLARLVILDRITDAGAEGLHRVPLLDGILRLLPQTSSLAQCPDPVRWLASVAERCGGIHVLQYRDIEAHVGTLLDLLATPVAPGRTEIVHHPPLPLLDPVPEGMVVRAPYLDAIEVDEDVLVFRESVGYLLNQLGATLWQAAAVPRTVADLVAAARLAHGDHPEAERLVGDALEVLRHQGLLT